MVFELQEEYPALKLAVITPFYEQEERWNEQNKELYEGILAQADFVESVTHRPYESPAQFKQKNRFLLKKQMDSSSFMIRSMMAHQST